MGFVKRNVDKTHRNGRVDQGTNTVKYVSNGSFSDGKDGSDSYTVIATPDTKIFEAGPTYAKDAQSDRISIIAFRGLKRIPTQIGTITADMGSGSTSLPTGLSATVANNETSGAYIDVAVNSTMSAVSGKLIIPVTLNTQIADDSSTGADIWDTGIGNVFVTKTVYYNWALAIEGKSDYRLDLTNENASVNCDKNGNIVSTAYQYLHCDANLLHGGEEVNNATYSISYSSGQSVTGVSINSSTGVFTFASNFGFTGDALEITVIGKIGTTEYGRTIMTITKSYPGADGHDAVSYWLELSGSEVKVDPNVSNPVAMPATITAVAKKQVGNNAPTTASDAVIKYGYNVSTATIAYPSGGINVDISKDYLRIEMYVAGHWVDGETIQIMYEGTNGHEGQSVYRLDLTNENASINCDSNGNILSGAVRPTCTARLYYGQTAATGVTYSLSNAAGATINSSTGVMNFNSFAFTGSSNEITVTAKIGSTTCGTAIMTISKSIAGAEGDDAVSYWLVLSNNEVRVDTNNNNACSPTTITASMMKQVGANSPVSATDCTLSAAYNDGTAYTNGRSVNAAKSYITFTMKLGNTTVDTETVPILRDGLNGSPGAKGDQGLKGAVVRGPVNWWEQTSSRRFCNGTLTDNNHPEDAQWIDLIVKDNNYYLCTTSYTGSCNDTWSNVSSKWTSANNAYKFIATEVLLATNAKVKYMSSNQITLMNDAGTAVVAGAQGGSGINFWAGTNAANPTTQNISAAPFKVYNNGKVEASYGYFSGAVQMPYAFITTLSRSGNNYTASDTSTYYIADEQMSGYSSGLSTLLLPDPTSSHNGKTYHIIAPPRSNYSGNAHNLPVLIVQTTSNQQRLKIYCTDDYSSWSDSFNKFYFYGGHFELTCVPVNGGNYYWALTRITGNVEAFKSGGNPVCATGSVYSWSTYAAANGGGQYQLINKIVTDNNYVGDSSARHDVLYIPRS